MIKKIQQIKDHLEFLGYSNDEILAKNPGEKDVYIAEHVTNNNVVFFELGSSLVMFRVNLTTEKIFSPEMNAAINQANKILSIAKIYYEIDPQTKFATLRLEAIYTGEYDKLVFGQFFEIFKNDQQSMYRIEGFSEAFIN